MILLSIIWKSTIFEKLHSFAPPTVLKLPYFKLSHIRSMVSYKSIFFSPALNFTRYAMLFIKITDSVFSSLLCIILNVLLAPVPIIFAAISEGSLKCINSVSLFASYAIIWPLSQYSIFTFSFDEKSQFATPKYLT